MVIKQGKITRLWLKKAHKGESWAQKREKGVLKLGRQWFNKNAPEEREPRKKGKEPKKGTLVTSNGVYIGAYKVKF